MKKKMIMYRFLSEVERITEEKNLSRKDLAKLIGTSASYITQLFRGHKIVNLETIAKIQKALDFKFEIKAIPNITVNSYVSLNVEDIYENQEQAKGFWAFHSISPSYDKPYTKQSFNEPNQLTA
jgi:transcriptional regulator with XRE-family HTH domain